MTFTQSACLLQDFTGSPEVVEIFMGWEFFYSEGSSPE